MISEQHKEAYLRFRVQLAQDYVNMIKKALFGARWLRRVTTSVEASLWKRWVRRFFFCLPPLSAHDSRHRLLSNEYVPVACAQCRAYE